MSFRDSVVRGVTLIREAIQSANFVTGVSGWTINRDGTVEFASAIVRGLIEVIGANGAKIRIDPQTYPIIQFFSPDGTASAFMRIVTGLAGDKANLDIRSGSFTDVDGIPRTFIVQLNENNTAFRFVDNPTGQTAGGMFRALTHSAYFGVEDTVNVVGAYVEVRNDTVPPRINLRNTDASLPEVATYHRGLGFADRILDTSHIQVPLQAACNAALTLAAGATDVPNCAITFDTKLPNAIVLVTGHFEFETTVAQAGGVNVGSLGFDFADVGAPLAIGSKVAVARQHSSQTWRVTVAGAGSHEAKLRARFAGTVGGSSRVNVTQTTITVTVFERPV